MIRILLTITIILLQYNTEAQNTSVSYIASTADITNPGRGLYKHYETQVASGAISSPLSQTAIENERTNNNITIIFRLYYLGAYKSSNLPASVITGIQNDFNVIRAAGAKVILRFAYNNSNQTHRHNDDASKSRVLNHIGQLTNVLRDNSDVILTTQIGFVGTWGEWFYTHPDFTNSSPLGSPNYTNRKQVSDSLLKVFKTDKQIQIRTPYYKYNAAMYGNGSSGTAEALTAAQAFDGSAKARIAHHNDCFLAAADDWGTYVSSPYETDKAYLEQDTKYLINGGETCNDNATYTNCTNAQSELARFHFTYLNSGYHPDVLSRWSTQGCYNTIKQKLGYRLELVSGTFTSTASTSFKYDVSITLRNVGYAAPVDQRRKVELVLKNNTTSAEYKVVLSGIDTRTWLPGSNYTINTSVGIGAIPNGNYNLYLAIRDTGVNITNNAKYAIQFANTSTWDAAGGYNFIKAVTVNSSVNPGTGVYSGSQWFGTASTLSSDFAAFSGQHSNGKNILNWKTLNQNNLSYFEIERSTNGQQYQKIGVVNITAATTQYEFVDISLGAEPLYYYRIKIIKLNGEYSYSNIIKLSKQVKQIALTAIYPQPLINKLNIELQSDRISSALIKITDFNGRINLTKKVSLQNGTNTINGIDVEKLAPGTYLFSIETNDTVRYAKIVKQ